MRIESPNNDVNFKFVSWARQLISINVQDGATFYYQINVEQYLGLLFLNRWMGSSSDIELLSR